MPPQCAADPRRDSRCAGDAVPLGEQTSTERYGAIRRAVQETLSVAVTAPLSSPEMRRGSSRRNVGYDDAACPRVAFSDGSGKPARDGAGALRSRPKSGSSPPSPPVGSRRAASPRSRVQRPRGVRASRSSSCPCVSRRFVTGDDGAEGAIARRRAISVGHGEHLQSAGSVVGLRCAGVRSRSRAECLQEAVKRKINS